MNPGTRGRSQPTLAIIAGPNGSGKSSFYELYLRNQFPRWVNADEVALTLTQVVESSRNLEAARQAESIREQLLAEGATFAFETVFSRTEHWIGFLEKAKALSYRLNLFFICTSDPVMNAARVKTRVGRGGHSVNLAKVVARYPGSIRTALAAKKNCGFMTTPSGTRHRFCWVGGKTNRSGTARSRFRAGLSRSFVERRLLRQRVPHRRKL